VIKSALATFRFRLRQFGLGLVVVAAVSGIGAADATPTGLKEAIDLFRAKKYPDARAALEKYVTAHPESAAGNYYLGRTLELRGDRDALPDAVKRYEKAVELEPENPTYLGRYGGASLQLAERTTSLGAARRGRDAMEKAVKLDPSDLDAREGLYQFYTRAPWPLGSSARAAAHLDAIRQRDPGRAMVLSELNRINDGDYSGAFKLCDEALAHDPANYNALFQYGRTAGLSGDHLDLGLARLRQCLDLSPPTPGSPSHSEIWRHIGTLREKLHQPAEARTAYEKALQLDAGNREAASALAKLKS
jgi:tetratricopeptide (TPR) repeat protein